MPKNSSTPKTSSGKKPALAKAKDHSTKRARPTEDETIEDLKASLKILALINGTLDEAALKIGSEATREMVLTLLILRKNPKGVSGNQLVELYAAWSGEKVSEELKDSVFKTLEQMRRAKLVQATGVENGEVPLADIRTTDLGDKRGKAIRKTIDSTFDLVKSALQRNRRKKFIELITASLPLPRSGSHSPRPPKV